MEQNPPAMASTIGRTTRRHRKRGGHARATNRPQALPLARKLRHIGLRLPFYGATRAPRHQHEPFDSYIAPDYGLASCRDDPWQGSCGDGQLPPRACLYTCISIEGPKSLRSDTHLHSFTCCCVSQSKSRCLSQSLSLFRSSLSLSLSLSLSRARARILHREVGM